MVGMVMAAQQEYGPPEGRGIDARSPGDPFGRTARRPGSQLLPLLLVTERQDLVEMLLAGAPGAGFLAIPATASAALAHARQLVAPALTIIDQAIGPDAVRQVERMLGEMDSNRAVLVVSRRGAPDVALAGGRAHDAAMLRHPPVTAAEWSARLLTARALIDAREPVPQWRTLRIGLAQVDLSTTAVWREGRPVPVSDGMRTLLGCLVRRLGQPVGHAEALAAIGSGPPTRRGRLAAALRGLRHAFERDPYRPHHVVNERGVGYRLHLW